MEKEWPFKTVNLSLKRDPSGTQYTFWFSLHCTALILHSKARNSFTPSHISRHGTHERKIFCKSELKSKINYNENLSYRDCSHFYKQNFRRLRSHLWGFASKAKLEGCKHSLEKEKHFLNLRQVKSHQIPDDATHLWLTHACHHEWHAFWGWMDKCGKWKLSTQRLFLGENISIIFVILLHKHGKNINLNPHFCLRKHAFPPSSFRKGAAKLDLESLSFEKSLWWLFPQRFVR